MKTFFHNLFFNPSLPRVPVILELIVAARVLNDLSLHERKVIFMF